MPYGNIDLNTSTSQEVFDYIIKHLRNQGERATDNKNGCVYRSDRGLACAIGCLIPDSEYNEFMEGLSFDQLSRENESEEWFIKLGFGKHYDLLDTMQSFHDTSTTWLGYTGLRPYSEFEAEAARIARMFDLTLSPRTEA